MNEKLLNKLAKLKALSSCPTGNENERVSAAAAMASLLLKYELEEADIPIEQKVELEEDFEFVYFLESARVEAWQKSLASMVAKVCFCATLFTAKKGLLFVGKESRVQAAIMLFNFIWAQIKAYSKSQGASYRLGMVQTVNHKLQELYKTPEGERALVLARDANKEALSWFEQNSGLGVRKGKPNNVRYDATEYYKGQSAGHKVDVDQKGSRKLPKGRVALPSR